MKIILLFISILSFSSNLLAQNNTFPTDNATWTNRYQTYNPPGSGGGWIQITNEIYTKYCVFGIDTAINAINYYKIFKCDLLSSNYFGAFRENAGQVFFVPADSTNEFLLYDFTLNAGDFQDVIVLQDAWGDSFSIVNTQISSVDTITVNNTQRRILYTNDGHSWTEGIGSSSGLFKGNPTNVSNYFIDLICASSENTIIFDFNNSNGGHLEQGIQGECDLALTIQEADLAANFSIYPNPTTGLISFELTNSSSIASIQLISNTGQIISSQTPTNSNIIDIEIEGAKGLYFVVINLENGETVTHKITKN